MKPSRVGAKRKAPVMKYGYSCIPTGRWVAFEKDSPKGGDPALVHAVRFEASTSDEAAKWVLGYNDGYRSGVAKPGPWSMAVLSAYSEGYETGVADYCRDME